MIVPSIDLMGGQAVQLRGGREKVMDAGDPVPIAERFGVVGDVAVIDLDAALGQGDNATIIRDLLGRCPCRVGGGIRDVDTARAWLDAGAEKIILGTAARPEVLRHLPAGRVIAALDAEDGEVVVEGWRKRTGRGIVERMAELNPYVGGYLVTFVESEGRLQGIDMERVRQVVQATFHPVTVAGGVSTTEELAAIDALGADAQVGMALYTGRFSLADALAAVLRSDRPDGLWPTVVADERGVALGLAYSDQESLAEALESRRGVYHSRSRGLWVKGATSGATQKLLRVDADCDRDALRFTVTQREGFCHTGARTCFGEDAGLGRLARRVASRVASSPEGSYTRRLLDDRRFLRAKLLEEAGELSAAETGDEVAGEAADLMYLALVAMARAGVDLARVERVLDGRSLKVSRRPGHAKPPPPLKG